MESKSLPSRQTFDDDELEDIFFQPNPNRTQADVDADVEYFLQHPLSAKKITPEMLEMPEYQALQQLAFEGPPKEVAMNFKKHGYEKLEKVIAKETKNERKEIEEAIYCFDTALEQKFEDDQLKYMLYLGRAKTNIMIGQFGRVKEDCLEAKKYKDSEQLYFILARSRFFVDKFHECMDYVKLGLAKFPASLKLKDLQAKCRVELEKEEKRISEVSTLQTLQSEKKFQVYRALRDKGVKLGKKVHFLPEIVDVNIWLDKQGLLHFPVLILYGEYMTSDFVQDFREDSSLKQQFSEVFRERAPWDEENKYKVGSIEVYFEGNCTQPLDPKEKSKESCNQKYFKCDMEQNLLQVLQHPFNIIPQYPVLYVVAKKSAYRSSFLSEI